MRYFPEFTGPIEGYVVNFSARNVWRVERMYNIDDLKQEGFLIYLKCAERYPDCEGPAHFMALFKRAWFNRFTDLSREDTASRILVPYVTRETEERSGMGMDDQQGESDNDGYLSALLRQAPREISMVLNLFLNAPQELLDLALSSWGGRDARCKAGGSLKICNMLGIDPDKDILKAVEEYLTSK